MKILFLPNWKILQASIQPDNMQPPDYYLNQDKYWFFKYMSDVHVTVVDITSMKFVENIENKILHFYVIQKLRVLLKISNYNLVISHGMQRCIVLALICKIFKRQKKPHIVFDIDSFNSARESGFALYVIRLLNFICKRLNLCMTLFF